MKFGIDIKGSQRMNPNDFSYSLPFHIAPSRGNNINFLLLFIMTYLQNNYCYFNQERQVNEVEIMFITPDICDS